MLLLSLAAGCSVDAIPSGTPTKAPSPSEAPVAVLHVTSLPNTALRPSEAPTGALLAASIGRGWATYYDDGPGRYAAAGPALRQWLGEDWRGKTVLVTAENGKHTTVRLSDWCACGDRHGLDTLIDLSERAFMDLAPLSQGVVLVDIELSGLETRPLPATETK